MSISLQTARSQFTLASKPETLTIPWYYLAAGDLKVVRTRSGVDTDATLSTHYTVAGAGNEAGGSVTVLNNSFWTVGDTVTVHRAGQLVQPTEFPANGQFPSASAEAQADRLTMLLQQLALELKRSVRFPTTQGEVATVVGAAADRANKFLGFDGSGVLALLAGGGAAGPGVPAGGAIYSRLKKSSAVDFATQWVPERVIDVKDFGAVGDGSTNDVTAITAAIAALTNNSALYFPPGKYRINGGLPAFANLTNVAVFGDAAELYNTWAGNTLVFESTCSGIDVRNLRFTGNASVRANGIHIRCHADNVAITNCYFQGCSDFGVFIGHDDIADVARNVYVEANIFEATLGDGVHVMNAENVVIADNVFRNTGDDSIGIIADYPARNPKYVTISGNLINNSASRGIAVAEADEVHIVGNQIQISSGAAIDVGRYNSTTFYNSRIIVQGNKINLSTSGGAGPRGAVWMKFSNQSVVQANQIVDTQAGSAISFLDCSDLLIADNHIRNAPSRGIATDDSTTANVGATWSNIIIQGNALDYVVANEAIYVVPAATKAIETLIIAGNSGVVVPGTNWIYYNRITTGRVVNNTNTSGRSVAAGGSVTSVTTANNN